MRRVKIIYIILFFMLMNIMPPQGFLGANQAYAAAKNTEKIKILEIKPDYTDDYQLYDYNGQCMMNGRKIVLTKMTLNQFISMRDDINGEYDIVYFSKGHYGYTGCDSDKRYNDITDLRAKAIDDMIESGQSVIIHEDAFEDHNSKMYADFNKYDDETEYPNFMKWHEFGFWIFGFWFYGEHPRICDLEELYSNSKIKLNVQILGYPNNEYSSGSKVTISFNASSYNACTSGYTANLYIDTNRDSLFKDDEKKVCKSHLNFGTINNLEYTLPFMYTAPLYYKLEICEEGRNGNFTGIKYVQKGSFNYKGKPISAKVLQISPGTNKTLDLNEQFTKVYTDGHPLGKSDDYNITVDNTVTGSFQNAFTDIRDPNYIKYHSLGTNYDMLVLGFADMYQNGDIVNKDAMNAILSYNKTGQGMMLTHDTIWYVNSTDRSFPVNISRYFVKDAGQSYTEGNLYKKVMSCNDIYEITKKIENDTYKLSEAMKKSGNYVRFSYYRPIDDIPEGNRSNGYTGSDQISGINSGVITDYPYRLGSSINVGTTHDMYYTLNLEDENVIPWYNLNAGRDKDSTNSEYYYYTYSTKNLTFSGTGHSPDEIAFKFDKKGRIIKNGKIDELKLFVNTVIKGFLAANHKPEIVVKSPEYHPDKNADLYEEISGTDENIEVSFIPYDYDLSDADKVNVSILMQSSDGKEYKPVCSCDNLRSGDTVIKSFKNPYKGSDMADKIVYIKFIVSDSSGASAEQIVPVKFVNRGVLPKPLLDYSIFQNTHTPVISGIGGTADDKSGYIINAWITDSNNKKYGPIQGKTGSDGRFNIKFGNIPDTIDFSKPYKVFAQQLPKIGAGGTDSDIAAGNVYIDTEVPFISDMKANDKELLNNSTAANVIDKISFTVTDNDPEIVLQNREMAIYKLDPATGQYTKLLGQTVKNGLNEYHPNPSLDAGDYKMTIEAQDRAGNTTEKEIINFKIIDDFSKVFQFKFASIRGEKVIAMNGSTVAINITVSVKDIKDPEFNNISDIKIPLCFQSTDKSSFDVFKEGSAKSYIKALESTGSGINIYNDNIDNSGNIRIPDLLKDKVALRTDPLNSHMKEPIYINIPGSISRTDTEKTYSFLVKCKTESVDKADKLNIFISPRYPILYKVNLKDDVNLILDNSRPIEIPVIKAYLR